jgi:hypothetical protein
VRDQAGLSGGLFINRTEALRFAMLENARHPQAVIMVPGVLEFGTGGLFKVAVKNSKSICEIKSEPTADVMSHNLVAGQPCERGFMVAARR